MKCRLLNTEAELIAAREFTEIFFEKNNVSGQRGGARCKSFPKQRKEDAKAVLWLALIRLFSFFFFFFFFFQI